MVVATAPTRPIGRLEILARERQAKDLRSPPADCNYDPEAPERVLHFLRTYCQHTKGEWAGQPFEPAEWQIEGIIKPLFGWKRPNGKRRFRVAYIEVPRKQGKSTLAAGLGLYLLVADGEAGAEVYSAATTRDQAKLVWDQARQMVKANPALDRNVMAYQTALTVPQTNSTFKSVSREAGRLDGLNAHGVILDELHAHRTPEMWDVMTTATGARSQSLVIAITTAGVYASESIGWRQHSHASAILEGTIDDPYYFAYITGADPGDDWLDPETWRKANPGLGSTISMEYLEQQYARAAVEPSYQNTVRRYHGNEWVSQADRWLDMTVWEQGSLPPPHDLQGRVCYAGLDLASTRDVTALVMVFPDGDRYDVLSRYWVPGANIARRSHDDRVPYDAWARDGYITATAGDVFDDDAVYQEIMRLRSIYDIREIAYDPWGATQLAPRLEADGVPMVPFRQGFASMSGPTKELEKLVYSKRLRHDSDPVLRWMANNVTLETDPADNIKISKKESFERVDGMVALVMAIGRAMSHEDEPVWPRWGAV